MQASQTQVSTQSPSQKFTDSWRYARCIEVSRRIRWDIDRDVIRGREFDLRRKFLPDGLSCIDELVFLSPGEQPWRIKTPTAALAMPRRLTLLTKEKPT